MDGSQMATDHSRSSVLSSGHLRPSSLTVNGHLVTSLDCGVCRAARAAGSPKPSRTEKATEAIQRGIIWLSGSAVVTVLFGVIGSYIWDWGL